MNEPIINLINYLRKLSRQNVYIKSFGIGEIYELNESSNFQYPLLFLELPISSEINTGEISRMNLTFNLHAFTNIIADKNGNDVAVTEQMISKITNQINYESLANQDQLMNNAFKILAIICSKFALDAQEQEIIVNDTIIPVIVESITITNAERVSNKDLYQSTATISITINNSYLCPIDSFFDYNIK